MTGIWASNFLTASSAILISSKSRNVSRKTTSTPAFKIASDKTLTELAEAIEAADEKGELDVEYQSGVLTITLANKKQYVINQHVPMRQIWLSSPISGAGHFDYVAGSWKSTRGGQDLLELLAEEFKVPL